MLLTQTHHWLGFVLLAVLIFPACAAPMQSTVEHSATVGQSITAEHSATGLRHAVYKVTAVDEKGNDVLKVSKGALVRIEGLIYALGEQLGDDESREGKVIIHHSVEDAELPELDKYKLSLFKLSGGKFCDGDHAAAPCYGFVVTLSKGSQATTGAIITQKSPETHRRYAEVVKPLTDTQSSGKINGPKCWDNWLREFLTELKPIMEWVKAMALYKDPGPSKIVEEAAKFNAEKAVNKALYAEVAKKAAAKAQTRLPYITNPPVHSLNSKFRHNKPPLHAIP
ncbi:hypothetical protein BDP27DRAFT_1450425 [Rhodocollybia butyracea]|uniref:Uncharacterized protein n=1 Tax=Rhodocollybia butyracea TaxID=206335 RepID=A0A9P5PKM0_9AGAR|nr:hypothetical protein BDP27DRAFT_1450425 [Rhodocollybia butyracea]